VTVLVIRAHKRFGVCRSIALRGRAGVWQSGLLIEVSLEGCRISGIDCRGFAFAERVDVTVDGCPSFCGDIRWLRDGMIGLRLTQPLHHAELASLVHSCRLPEEARRA